MLTPGLLLVALAFVSGAVPYGLLLSRARGVDIRQVGSGNIGATNVARALGKRWAVPVLLLDLLKGFAPAVIARLLLPRTPSADLWIAGVMVAAVLGHMFTPFLRFRGGKGVATGFGVFLAIAPLAGAAGLVLYVGTYAAFRISSLGSLAGTLSALLATVLLPTPRPQCFAGAIIGLLIVAKHRANIARLLRGEEGKV
jgi:glycerol-3-phosphate acyltransferase PlsY